MNDNIAIKVSGVSKTFKIPHEKVTSLRGAAISSLRKLSLKGSQSSALGVGRTYEEFKALDDVSFEVKKGEFFGIIGRNGSGKSTLLKILAGIYQPDKGKVQVNGRISPFLELGIGFNPELSGRDNVYLNATVLGLSKKEIDEKFDSIVKFSELERFIDQKLKNYSSGMQVRLAFSVSIHANRDILLMDEVLAVGDSNFQSKCLREFAKYRNLGKTVILVTHDIDVVRKYCDKAMLVGNGNILKIGDVNEVGNEYIKRNMSEREFENSSVDKDGIFGLSESGNKLVCIKDIKTYDLGDAEKSVFQTNDAVKIKIFFEKKNDVEKINIGIGMYSDSGAYVFGYNTQMDGYSIAPESSEVTLNFDSLPLLGGNYFINVVCFGEHEQDFFDFAGRAKEISFFSAEEVLNQRGIISIIHKWK